MYPLRLYYRLVVVKIKIADKLKLIRKNIGLSQQALADNLGVKRATVSSWEAGRTEPDIATIVKIAMLTGVTTDFLLCMPIGYKAEDTSAQKMLTQIENLSPADRLVMEKVLAALQTDNDDQNKAILL